jgi:hypothetical protein
LLPFLILAFYAGVRPDGELQKLLCSEIDGGGGGAAAIMNGPANMPPEGNGPGAWATRN